MNDSFIKNFRQIITLPVVVIAMGYFVDIYDLILFGVVRVESLTKLGLKGEELTSWGTFILNAQMSGMLIGGILGLALLILRFRVKESSMFCNQNEKCEVKAGEALMYAYIGLAFGDFASGYLSQKLQSRKIAFLIFLILSILSIAYYYELQNATLVNFYFACFWLGLFSGYWAVFITMAAEQFGTNIRATVATTVPNL